MMQEFKWLPEAVKRKRYVGLTVMVVIVCIAGVMAWKGRHQTNVVADSVTVVKTAVIGTAATDQEYTYSGAVHSRYESQLAFQIGGKVVKRYVEIGSTVKAGDLLMQIDPKDLQQLVNSDSAQVYSAEANLKLAEANLKRFRQLYAHGVVSRATLDQYQTAYDMALAATNQTSAQLAEGKNQIGYSSLYADHSGVISQINVEAGQVVGTGQPVLVIAYGNPEVQIMVPENRIEELHKASRVKVTFWALPNVTTEGEVREIAPMADPVTRTYKVCITLLNPSPQVKLGMTASVTLLNSKPQAGCTVPLASIFQTADSPCVWVVKADTVMLRPVKVGKFGNGTVQVLAGLQPGERIVTAGVHKLREGQKVKLDGDAL
jgi:RND family efflux transporter MFP subunit